MRVGGELVAAAMVELVDRTDKAQVAFLDEVEEGEPATHVLLGDRHDEPEIGLDHTVGGALIAGFDSRRQRDLVLLREEPHGGNLLQIHAY